MGVRVALSQTTLPAPPGASAEAATKGYVDGLRGAANGVAPLDSGLLVPVAYLPAGVANGVASLDSSGDVPLAQLPATVELTTNKNQAGGYAGLDGSSKLTGSQQLYSSTGTIAAIGDANAAGSANSAARGDHVHAGVNLTGAQTVAGVKTFSSSPIVPTPTTSGQAATKGYADLMIPLTQRAAANGVATLDANTRIPVAQLPTPMARYRQDTTGQSIAATTDSRVVFNTALETLTGIAHTTSGSNPPAGQFLITLAGKWTIKVRLVYPFTAGLETWLWLGPTPTPTTTRWDLDIDVAPAVSGPPTTLYCEITRVFAANDTFSAWTWHNSGSAKSLDVSYGGIIHLEAIYEGAA